MRIKQMLYADSSLGKVQAVFSPKVKHRARVQLTIGQRTRVFPGVAREPVADHWLSRGTRARGAKPFFSAASALADLKSQACPEHFHGVEIKLGIKRALDVGGLAEAMLLTREQKIADWCPAVAQRLDHCLSLVRRHYRILVALEEDDGARKALGMKKRRAFAIECLVLRVRADQPIKVVRLELMGIARKRGDIAHAVITGAAREHIVEHERSERCVAASAAAADHHAISIHAGALSQKLCAVNTVINVDDALVEVKSVSVGPVKTTAASVIHVEHRNASARPVLDAEVKCRGGGRGRTTVALDK